MGDTNLGWWKGWHAGYANYGHPGAHVGFMSAALFVPGLKLAVAVQTNRWNPVLDTNDGTEVARELLARLIPVVERHRPAFDPAAVELERYAGIYVLPGEYASAQVTVQNGLLHVALRGVEADVMRLVPVGPQQFGPAGTTLPAVTFEADLQGNVLDLKYALFRFRRKKNLT